ncbi:hypothetical protein [Aquifex aeolicus]|uniref:hypothetical protein n=1 Tax=Aquifex aeolicus TaxID=63363 RepID=UPI0003179C98|nr:hypothetical protein [Aquifex aeolicus]
MDYKAYLFLHIFFAIVWIGGMFFNVLFLTPALRSASEDCRKEVAQRTLGRFFLVVWLAIIVLFTTGMALWHGYRKDFSQNPLFHFKLFLFGIMTLIFIYIHLYLYRKRLFSSIPVFVSINLILGTLIVMIITYIR